MTTSYSLDIAIKLRAIDIDKKCARCKSGETWKREKASIRKKETQIKWKHLTWYAADKKIADAIKRVRPSHGGKRESCFLVHEAAKWARRYLNKGLKESVSMSESFTFDLKLTLFDLLQSGFYHKWLHCNRDLGCVYDIAKCHDSKSCLTSKQTPLITNMWPITGDFEEP